MGLRAWTTRLVRARHGTLEGICRHGRPTMGEFASRREARAAPLCRRLYRRFVWSACSNLTFNPFLTFGPHIQGDLVWLRHPAHVWTAATVSGPQPADGGVVALTLDDKEVRVGTCPERAWRRHPIRLTVPAELSVRFRMHSY